MTAFGPQITCAACGHTWTLGRTMTPGDHLTYGYDVEVSCPACGRVDRSIRTGDTFSANEDGTIRRLSLALRPPGATVADYEQLASVLQGVLESGATAEQAADAVAEGSPFAALATWIKAHPDRTIAILSLLTALVFGILTASKPDPEPPPAPVVNVHIHEEPPSEDTVRRLVEEELKRRGEGRENPAMTDDDTRSPAEVAGDLGFELEAWGDRLPQPVIDECRRVHDGWLHDDPSVTPELVRRTEAALRQEISDQGDGG